MVTVIQGKLAVGVLVAALVLMSSVRAEEDASLPEFMVFGQPYKVVREANNKLVARPTGHLRRPKTSPHGQASRSSRIGSLKPAGAQKARAVGIERCENQAPLPKSFSPALRLRFSLHNVASDNGEEIFVTSGVIEHWEDYAVSRTDVLVESPRDRRQERTVRYFPPGLELNPFPAARLTIAQKGTSETSTESNRPFEYCSVDESGLYIDQEQGVEDWFSLLRAQLRVSPAMMKGHGATDDLINTLPYFEDKGVQPHEDYPERDLQLYQYYFENSGDGYNDSKLIQVFFDSNTGFPVHVRRETRSEHLDDGVARVFLDVETAVLDHEFSTYSSESLITKYELPSDFFRNSGPQCTLMPPTPTAPEGYYESCDDLAVLHENDISRQNCFWLPRACPDPECSEPPSCFQDGGEQCMSSIGFCRRGECHYSPKRDTTSCDDGDANTQFDRCHNGQCVGKVLNETAPTLLRRESGAHRTLWEVSSDNVAGRFSVDLIADQRRSIWSWNNSASHPRYSGVLSMMYPSPQSRAIAQDGGNSGANECFSTQPEPFLPLTLEEVCIDCFHFGGSNTRAQIDEAPSKSCVLECPLFAANYFEPASLFNVFEGPFFNYTSEIDGVAVHVFEVKAPSVIPLISSPLLPSSYENVEDLSFTVYWDPLKSWARRIDYSFFHQPETRFRAESIRPNTDHASSKVAAGASRAVFHDDDGSVDFAGTFTYGSFLLDVSASVYDRNSIIRTLALQLGDGDISRCNPSAFGNDLSLSGRQASSKATSRPARSHADPADPSFYSCENATPDTQPNCFYFGSADIEASHLCSLGQAFTGLDINSKPICPSCPVGSHGPKHDIAECVPCPANTFQPMSGAAVCDPCEPGFASAPGSAICSPIASSCGADCVPVVRSVDSFPVTVSADHGKCVSLEFQ